MKQTRNRSVMRRAQAGGRSAHPFVRIDAPVGGWNTRDSEDNVPPTDALEFDNWWADIGEVRTRPGYSGHCYTGDATTGSELISNGGFETAGALNTFDDWTDVGGVFDETSFVESDSHACKIKKTSPAAVGVSQAVTVSEETWYKLEFWSTLKDSFGSYGGYSTYYQIYDNDNSDYIVTLTETGSSGDEYIKTVDVFYTPSGCTSITITLSIQDVLTTYSGGAGYFDEVSLFEIASEPGSVETLAEYISESSRQLIAIDNGEAFNVTASTPTHLSSSIAEFTNSRFQTANFNGYLVMVNGAEQFQWDGTTFQSFTAAGVGLTGIGNPIGCNVFKNRMWYWEANSQDVWYTALYAHGGACTEFPLSRVGQFGGNLILMETWTRDGGSGPDDFAVFVMSSGEAIVYQGSYPGSSGDWALVGVYNIGEPLGYRSATKFGGDLYIITNLDIVKMSEVIQGAEARQMETKISSANRTAVSLYKDNWGWEASIYPRGHMAIFNIPVIENEETDQHARNTLTGAWSRFKGIMANTWCMFNGDMYIGSNDGEIYKFDDGDIDYEDSIESTLQTAWMPIGGTGANKLFKAVREAYKTNTDITVSNMFATDFKAFSAQQFPVAVDEAGAYWSILPSTTAVSPWDTTPWNAGDTIYNEWEIIGAFGERISMRKRLNTKQKVTLLGYDWLVESGGRL